MFLPICFHFHNYCNSTSVNLELDVLPTCLYESIRANEILPKFVSRLLFPSDERS